MDESDTELDNAFQPIDNEEANDIHADATREQASADDTMPDLLERDADDDASLPKLRRRRAPDYNRLKGRDGDGSLVTLKRPDEFRGGRHQSHIILQSIIMTQIVTS
jgi:hypothetical protein